MLANGTNGARYVTRSRRVVKDYLLNGRPYRADNSSVARVKVFNVITKLSVGGAQETVLRSSSMLDARRWESVIVAGPDLAPEGDLHEEAARLGVEVMTVPSLHRPVRPLTDLRAVVELVRLLRRERPDVVHTHSSKAGVIGRLAARLAGVPVIVHTVHGWSFHEGMGRLPRALAVAVERLAARVTSAMVVVADRDADIGRAARIARPDSYALVRSGVDLAAFRGAASQRAAARLALGVPEGVPLVGTITRLFPQKDPRTLLHAARRIVDARPDARVVVVGDGPLRDEVEALVDELGLRRNVTLLGSMTDVAALLPGFDVFLLSSRWEGLPRVVIEAMAVGVPVVSTDVGGVSEAVDDGITGLLAPAGDDGALAAAVLRILGEPGLAASLVDGAAARIDEFDAATMVEALDDLYTGLVTGGRSRPRRVRMARAVRTASTHEAA
jgi:glycosyltransferase involved in cell wall biosynthesis